MEKDFKTYEEQVEHLKKKNLTIEDEEKVISVLKKYSYFNIVNGYKHPFKTKNCDYKNNTRFNDLLLLYSFDEQLRNILMKYILIVELHMKSLLSYEFCNAYGAEQSEYLNCKNYEYEGASMQRKVNSFIQKLNETLDNKKDMPPYLKHQQKHNNIPLWALVKVLTMGSISKMYSIQKFSIQSKISHEFPEIREDDLAHMLDITTRFRNVCAHNERLFDFVYYKSPIPQNRVSSYFFKGSHPRKSNLFGMFIILKYLLDDVEFGKFIDEFSEIYENLFKETHQIQKKQLLKLMGFPENWTEIKSLSLR